MKGEEMCKTIERKEEKKVKRANMCKRACGMRSKGNIFFLGGVGFGLHTNVRICYKYSR
jgi:hypothetical protein